MPDEGNPDQYRSNTLPVMQPLAYQPVQRESGALTAWSIFLFRFFIFMLELVAGLAALFAVMSYWSGQRSGEFVLYAAACGISAIAAFGLRKLADWIW